MSNRGISIIPVLIGFAILVGAALLFSDVLSGFFKQEKQRRSNLTQTELVSYVAQQFQNLSREDALCYCCLALKDPLPTGFTLNRTPTTSCPNSCTGQLPFHGYRDSSALPVTTGITSETTYVTVEKCDEFEGLLQFVVVGARASNWNQQSRVEFAKGGY